MLFNKQGELVALAMPRMFYQPLDENAKDYWPEGYQSAQLVSDLVEQSPILASIARSGNGFEGLTPALKIVNCFSDASAANRSVTIKQVFQCSVFWVTPRALMMCSLGETCPALPDTVEGRTSLDFLLTAEGLNRDSPLVLRQTDIPRLPDAETIQNCDRTTGYKGGFQTCVVTEMSKRFDPILKCFQGLTDGEKLACFVSQAKDPELTNLVGCMGGGNPSISKMMGCVKKQDAVASAEKARDCIATSTSIDTGIDCLVEDSSSIEGKVAHCMAAMSDDPINVLG
ncbi:hypothetical protein [Mesorhizobium sp. SP-1A]|uniref:hypothetical protein n=1 Tax=Mesorhizobium sp. SP-1A TaxID=3077840 RepID=UPI0028F6DC7A|nr:hypothetical protein [Mesorhizobium sp. SP-1A]